MKKTHKDVPGDYPTCLHSDCPMASSCLRQTAYHRLLETERTLTLLNPCQCTKDETCPHYRSNVPVTFACGFTTFRDKMLPGQYAQFLNILSTKFGRRPYFKRRNGTYTLPPSEQEVILQALKKVGITEEFKFDRYEQLPNWND